MTSSLYRGKEKELIMHSSKKVVKWGREKDQKVEKMVTSFMDGPLAK